MQGNDGLDSDRDSDAGQGEPPPSKSSSKGKDCKETVAGRAEQRRTRKREKVNSRLFTGSFGDFPKRVWHKTQVVGRGSDKQRI
jgi:hypothetical protein